METIKFTFNNKGIGEYNDDVFNREFDLSRNNYNISLHPKVAFWRFGIVLSNEPNFDFDPNVGRYKNERLKFIQINVGDYLDKLWFNPNKMEVQTYYVDNPEREIERDNHYVEFSEVVLSITCDTKGLFYGVLTTGDKTTEIQGIPIGNYRYFKLFAWADEITFEIECLIAIVQKSKFNFPTILINDNTRKFLDIIYQRFLYTSQPEDPYTISELWNDLSDFSPNSIDKRLLESGRYITLWGIWHIDPGSDIFEKFDNVILFIRNLLGGGKKVSDISSTDIQAALPQISNAEMRQVSQLMQNFRSFTSGIALSADQIYTIHLGSESILEEYRNYKGLQKFFTDYLELQGVKTSNTSLSNEETDYAASNSPAFAKTKLSRRSAADFKPVFDVSELSNDFANNIYELLGEKAQMIGVFGRWGRGKTFFLNELWKVLKNQKAINFIRVDFHAWKYQETPASWAYLYQILSDKYLGKNKKGNRMNYQLRLIRLNLKRNGWTPIIGFFLTVVCAIAGMTYTLMMKQTITFIGITAGFLSLLTLYFQKLQTKFSTKANDLIKKYSIRHGFKEVMGIQADIQDELIKLLQVWISEKNPMNEKIVLFVEDIDRCTEDRVIQNIDALRTMLEDEEVSKRLIVITAIDERILKNAIFTKYRALNGDQAKDLNDTSDNTNSKKKIDIKELVSEYLDKLFISAIKLGTLSGNQKEEYLDELFRHQDDKSTYQNESQPEIIRQGTVESPLEQRPPSTTTSEPSPLVQSDDYDIFESNEEYNTETVNGHQQNENVIPEWRKLTDLEKRYIKDNVRSWTAATPRHISIFYYRYLFSKNLIINKYNSLQQSNPWQSKHHIQSLLNILKYYTDLYDPEKIQDEKNLISEKADTVTYTVKPEGTGLKLSKQDYIRLLEILEFVIAY